MPLESYIEKDNDLKWGSTFPQGDYNVLVSIQEWNQNNVGLNQTYLILLSFFIKKRNK